MNSTEQTLQIISNLIAWISSLGAGGIFLFFALFRKLTKAIIRLVLTLGIIAIGFFLISNYLGV